MHVRVGLGELPQAALCELGFSLYEIQPDVRVASPIRRTQLPPEEVSKGDRDRQRERRKSAGTSWQTEKARRTREERALAAPIALKSFRAQTSSKLSIFE